MSSSNNNKNHELSSNDEDGVLQVKFLSNNAIMPTRGSPHAAGFDLSASEATIVPAGGRVVVKTDLCIACPVGTYARIAPRR
jgi:dUTP pyrophosphatase